MRSDDITIISPSEKFEFVEGESQNLVYTLRNNTDHTIRDINFTVNTIKPDGTETSKKYAVVGALPKVILAHKEEGIMVSVTIPNDYAEYVNKSDGSKGLVPFRLHSFVEGRKYVEEL